MPGPPVLTFPTPQDGNTILTAAYLGTLQSAIQNYGAGFMPLIGGTFSGAVNFASSQTIPGSLITLNDPTYPHGGFVRTLVDHVNDSSIHLQVGPPQAHAPSHGAAGSDPLFGDVAGISALFPGITIKKYIDNTVNAASAVATQNYAPSSRYQIGGATPIFGNMTAVSAASASTDLVTYINNQITTATSGPYPTNPAFQTVQVTATAGLSFQGVPAMINTIVGGATATLFRGDGTNLFIAVRGANGNIQLGNQVSPTLFGQLSAAGYTIGNTNIGPSAGVIDGGLTANNDLNLNRSKVGSTDQGLVSFGTSKLGFISFNADVAKQFYVNAPVTFAGNLTLAATTNLSIAGIWSTGQTATVTTNPGIHSDGTNVYLNAKNAGVVGLGYDNATLGSIQLGPAGAWGSFAASGLTMGSTVIGAASAQLAGALSLNGAYVAAGGDLGIANSASTGRIYFGQSTTAAYLDYGGVTTGYWTLGTRAGGTLVQVKSDGTVLTGASTYGPTSASVNGSITAIKGISAQTGATFNNLAGFTFTGNNPNYDTGMFSTGPGDLRFYTGQSNMALQFQANGQNAQFLNNVTLPGALTTNTLSVSAAAVINGLVTLGSGLSFTGASAPITKFRVKSSLHLGYQSGVVNNSTPYANIVVPTYTGGQIEGLRISTLTADTNATQSTVQITRNGVNIGTVTLPPGSKLGFAFPTTNPQVIAAGDQLQAVVTTVGTCTGLAVSLDISQLVY